MSFKNELSKELSSSWAVRLLTSVEGMLSRKSRLKSAVCPAKEDVLWSEGNECESLLFWLCIELFCDIMEFCIGLFCACIGPVWLCIGPLCMGPFCMGPFCMGPFCMGLPWCAPMPPIPPMDIFCDWDMWIFGICEYRTEINASTVAAKIK